MTIAEILAEARGIWGKEPMSVAHIAVASGVVHGDISRQARSQIEQGAVQQQELQKELGNLIASAVRWCDDLGYDPETCIRLALQSQSAYKKKSN